MHRFSPENSLLLVIDLQGKLAQRMFEKEALFDRVRALIQAFGILDIPTLLTEQAPDKIGGTIDEVTSILKEKAIAKTTFSCALNQDFMKTLRSFQRKQIVVCGIETHVCVIQTVFDLLEQQLKVQVVADAVSSRSQSDRDFALRRMENARVPLTSTEMIICELLKGADHPKFKNIMALLK